MSTEPKGELVGTTAEELHAQVCRERGWHWEWTKRDLQVALAAQKAVTEWLLAGHGEWHDVPEAGGRCYCIYEADMLALKEGRAK